MLDILLAIGIALGLAGIAEAVRADHATAIRQIAAGLCFAGVMAAVAGLVLPPAAAMPLPVGPPGAALVARLDGVSGFVLIPVLIGAGAAMLLGPRPAPLLPLLASALVLTLLAGNSLGFWVFLAAAIAAGWLARLQGPLAPGMAPGMLILLPYLLLRLPPIPVWAGLLLLALGSVVAFHAAAGSLLEGDMPAIGAAAARQSIGLAVAAVGLAAAAPDRAMAGLALSAVLLQLLAGGLGQTLLAVAADAVATQAGSARLDRLGGLVHFMPLTAACLGTAAASMSALPFTPGFGALWLLFQSVIAARPESALACFLLAAAALLVAASAALALSAMLRLFVTVFLGRPRAVRAAGAREATRPQQLTMAILAGLIGLAGLFPGAVVWLAGPALAQLTGTGPGGDLLSLAAPGTDYAPFPIAVLIALTGLPAWLLRRRGVPAVRHARAWEGGNEPPPPFLPFGDTATQYGPASLAEPVGRALGARLFAWRLVASPAEPGGPAPVRFALSWSDPAGRIVPETLALARPCLRRAARLGRRVLRYPEGLLLAAVGVLLVVAALAPA